VLGNARLPGPFSRVPIVWVIAIILFVLAGLSAVSGSRSGNQQALILAVIGVVLVLRGAMVFHQRRDRAGPARGAFLPPSDIPLTVIEASKLVKRYEKLVAVDDVSFSVHRGEIFGLLGPNGAGKSTTLEMLEGLRDIDSGTAVVLGTDVTTNAVAVKRRIGVQLQATALPSFTTVAESIDLFRAFYDHTRDTADLLEEFDLVPQAKQLTTKLSGGQQQRLSIALAMVNDPDVVFLDEPTTGLDPQARISLWDFIERFRARGKTVMLTTHYMEEAERLCDRVAVMDLGRIVALDTPDRLVELHASGTTITFTSPTTDTVKLRALTGVESAEVSGGFARLVTRSPEVVLAQLLHPDGDHPNGISNLRMERGTLEDVFIALTGRELRS
jgi:ABC-2 type transport system ATP-binding protein